MRVLTSTTLALAVLAWPLTAQIPSYDGPPPDAVATYGSAPQQYGELRLPEGEGPFPVVVTIHGGCWLDNLGEGSITPAAVAITETGIATWDIHYRRLGHDGGGWPGTFQDVGSAIDHLRTLATEYPLDLDRVALAGHSSGAHLAVWAAGRTELPESSPIRGASPLPVRAAVAADGPMDLAAWGDSGADAQICGSPVIHQLMGGSSAEQPERYAQASPIEMASFDAEIFLNPAELVLATGGHDGFVAAVNEANGSVTVRPIPDSDHFQLITPSHPTWATVLDTIREALGLN